MTIKNIIIYTSTGAMLIFAFSLLTTLNEPGAKPCTCNGFMSEAYFRKSNLIPFDDSKVTAKQQVCLDAYIAERKIIWGDNK